jgi:hypothetical protein
VAFEIATMLRVQQYLRDGHSLGALADDLGIAAFRHPELPLVGLKYESHAPKAHPLVRECRGLVLEVDSWDVVAKPFDRFYNAGEDLDALAAFDWSSCTCQAKEDGSLLIVYAYRGAWHVNSSGGFGHARVSFSRRTWAQLFWGASGLEPGLLDPGSTYVFELCSPYTKVVRSYPRTTAFLLSIFETTTCREWSVGAVDEEAVRLALRRPETYRLGSMGEVAGFLAEKERADPTFEGVIIRDDAGLRFKIKTRTYLEARHAEGGNLFHPKRLVPLVLSGEIDEVLAYRPEVREVADQVRAEVHAAWEGLRTVWERTWRIDGQADFARAIVGATPFTGLLFSLRRRHGAEQTEVGLRRLWLDSAEEIVKALYERGRR